ncbi:hypothetical protein AB6A40_004133 [Gnathostoma spinigerum]|uniref:Uncharacterized protein n=1 Tax=Gnathostoma spinigerum TaxID=75299 RepID=A0ABD6EH00_9BILA
MGAGKKLSNCMKMCMDKKIGKCARKANCGLDLPSDSVLIQTGKQCATRSGLTNQVVRALCGCVANAGMPQLQSVCNRLNIF